MKRSSDPLAELQDRFADLERRVNEANNRPFRIPVLNADPPEADPTNIWMFPDGRIRARHLNSAGSAYVIREWVPTAAGSSTSGTAPAAPSAAPTTRQGVWTATWSQSYRSTGAARTDEGTVRLYYGSSGEDSFNGMNQSLVGFDYAAIATALSGSTINSVSLRLLNLHAWYNSGVRIFFGIHNYTAEPATWAGGGIPRSKVLDHKFGKPQERTVALPLEFAQAIRDGWGKGIALEAPNTSREFYGYAAGVGSGYDPPALIINYSK